MKLVVDNVKNLKYQNKWNKYFKEGVLVKR